jgi:transcriptional regulator with XRE-family HTH domain
MGRKPRIQPEKLASKLKTIRQGLGLTLEELAERLSHVPGAPDTGLISRYEQGESLRC